MSVRSCAWKHVRLDGREKRLGRERYRVNSRNEVTGTGGDLT